MISDDPGNMLPLALSSHQNPRGLQVDDAALDRGGRGLRAVLNT
jgi:hypothetical protein